MLRDDEEWDDWPEDDDETAVVECPNCGAEIYEEAPQCPVCGEYVVHDTSPWQGKPLWWIILGLLGVAAVIVVLSGLAGAL